MYVIYDVWYIVVGLGAGLLAHRLLRGKPSGEVETVADEATGLLGALLGGYIAGLLNIPLSGFTYALGISVVGAAALLAALHLTVNLRHHH
jgi:uncharacterized membrane protein YeaQ/YmgE (transglycosylase-associated protein family)